MLGITATLALIAAIFVDGRKTSATIEIKESDTGFDVFAVSEGRRIGELGVMVLPTDRIQPANLAMLGHRAHVAMVHDVWLEGPYIGKNIGLAMYQHAVREAQNRGLPLASESIFDGSTAESASAVWDRLGAISSAPYLDSNGDITRVHVILPH